jgi:predicted phosphohydrolase
MSIYAIADLHLSLSAPEKDMAIFGAAWANYQARIEENWKNRVQPEDLVLIAGDICWAMKLSQALVDLEWIHQLPGTKILLRGNHDYWWSSLSKMKSVLPPSLHLLQNNAFTWGEVGICGARLWDTDEFSFLDAVLVSGPKKAPSPPTLEQLAEQKRLFSRELERLQTSIGALPTTALHRIAMTHYPPVGAELQPSAASALLERAQIRECVFGHLHSMRPDAVQFGTARGVDYHFVAADAVGFTPQLILEGAAGPLREWGSGSQQN